MLSDDAIIADLYKAGYASATRNLFDGGYSWVIRTSNFRTVRVTVYWGDDAVKVIAAAIERAGLYVPSAWRRPVSPFVERAQKGELPGKVTA